MIKTIFKIGCLLPLGLIGIIFMLGIVLAIFDNGETDTKSTEEEKEYQIIDGKKYLVENMPKSKNQTINPVPNGYFAFENEDGIYGQWCDNSNDLECPKPDYVSGDIYWSLKVWCKEKACGNIYARVNFVDRESDIVRDWTNNTAYGGQGQKVMLYFGTKLQGVQPEITEINFR